MNDFDYQYVNESNEFEVVKFTLDVYSGDVVCESALNEWVCKLSEVAK